MQKPKCTSSGWSVKKQILQLFKYFFNQISFFGMNEQKKASFVKPFLSFLATQQKSTRNTNYSYRTTKKLTGNNSNV